MTDNTNTDDIETTANLDTTGATELESSASEAVGQPPRHGFFTRLYTGTGAFEVVGRRKMWFAISALIVGVAAASILLAPVFHRFIHRFHLEQDGNG